MPAEIHDFFSAYRDAFNRLDGHAVSAHYAVPAMIAHASGNAVFADMDSLNANNLALCAQYAASGFQRADFRERSYVQQGNDFCVADLAWEITRSDQAAQRFNTSYSLRRTSETWKVFCVTAYEERRTWSENE
ncbi:MAG: hypothetical protein ABI583_00035 [Betaproteobacteria bacterium]